MRPASLSAFCLAACAATALCLGGCASESVSERQPLPNIVYILADDMGYGDPRCNNPESKVPTPFMDRLAAEGLRFTDAHTPSAVCTPTRYGLLTGRYCWRTRLKSGVLWGRSPHLIELGRMTVASLLRAHGYATACVGKWHLGLDWATTDGSWIHVRGDKKDVFVDYGKPILNGPVELGFDYFFGIPASLDMAPYVYVENERVVAAPTETIKGTKGLGFYRGGKIAPGFRHDEVLDVLTEKAVGFIDRHFEYGDGRPFFLYFPLPAPHTPVLPTGAYRGISAAGDYGDFVAQVDGTVGAVMQALEFHGAAGDTLLIVTSDNGSTMKPMKEFDHLPNGRLRGRKSDVWEGGHRVPFVVRWPGTAPAGGICDETVCLTDLLATCADIVGAELPDDAGEDSFTMLPALEGRELKEPLREATVHHSISGMFAVRQGRWKLVLGRGSGGWTKGGEDDPEPGQLYNMEADPGETTNLHAEKPDVVARLATLLERYRREGRSRPARSATAAGAGAAAAGE